MSRLRLCQPLMSDRESDIEFDFFEESDTRESAEERPRRRGPRPPVRPPTGLTPLLRLIGLISFAILIVLLLVLWVNGCREDQRKDTYKNYVKDVATFAASSQALGKSLNTLLTTPGTKEADVENELSGLAQQQEKLTEQAENLDPPGRLRKEHAHMLDTFALRAEGLNGLNAAFQTIPPKKATQAGNELAQQMRRLIASDVLWEDLVRDPNKKELANLSITGVNVPDSVFLRNTMSSTLMRSRLTRSSRNGAIWPLPKLGPGNSTTSQSTGPSSSNVSAMLMTSVFSLGTGRSDGPPQSHPVPPVRRGASSPQGDLTHPGSGSASDLLKFQNIMVYVWLNRLCVR